MPNLETQCTRNALVESLGGGVRKTGNSTIAGPHCHGGRGVFPGIFE